jgi:rod shape-determining protein MreB
MAAALGEGIEIFQSNGVMVVDIGGGTTEIAVISLGGIVVGRSLKVAGNDMDQAILHYVRLKHGMLLGARTAEDIKIKIGSAYKKSGKVKNKKPANTENTDRLANTERLADTESADAGESSVTSVIQGGEKMVIVRGRDLETGLPKSLRVTETEVREALSPSINEIIKQIGRVLEEAPPELISDILESGIVLTGGGANLGGLDQLIVEQTKMPVIVSDDPLTSVARGTGKVLEDPTLLSKVKVFSGIK